MKRATHAAFVAGTLMALLSCKHTSEVVQVQPTCASVEVLHASVTVTPTVGHNAVVTRSGRLELDGRVSTGADGRAIVRTDDGLELRLAGDTELRFHDGHASVDHGRVFASSWGDDERTLAVGTTITLGLGDAAMEVERTPGDDVRVIAVRGEASWRMASRQGRLQQGEALVGHGTPEVRPAAVWDDWTGGAASPQGSAPRGSLGTGRAWLHGTAGEAPTALAINEHHVHVSVEGDFALTVVSQQFFNGSEITSPVEYRVRIPDGAIVSHFRVERGGAVRDAVVGTVASRGPSGGIPALTATRRGDLLVQLESLAPGETVRCEIEYAEWLHHVTDHRTYVYPMGDPVDPPFVGEFTFDLNTARASVAVLRGPAGARIESTHLHIAHSDFRPRADLAVDLFDTRAVAPASARLWRSSVSTVNGAEYVLVDVNLPPPDEQGTDLVLLVDDSAGTDAGLLGIARDAVDALLQTVGPHDRVALMFGDVHARAAAGTAGELSAPSDARREAMLEAIAHVQPGGATDLGAMIADAYGRLDPRRNGAVIYLGDATPTTGSLDAARLTEETLRVAPDLRLYVLALGEEAHAEMLETLAHRGGLVRTASDGATAVAGAHALAAHAARGVLHDVHIDLGLSVAHPLPDTVDQWVAGDPLRIAGELIGGEPTQVVVTARTSAGPQRWTLPLSVDGVEDGGDIRRRWGLARFRALEVLGASDGALADLGVRFGLLTPSSAMVLGVATPTAGDDGTVGYAVTGSLWPEDGLASQLPAIGVRESVDPRGVRTMSGTDATPMVVDTEDGWQRHFVGENAWRTGVLGDALSAAWPTAQACVDRARSIRPAIAGEVTVRATVVADGHITDASIDNSSLGDQGAEGCIRRAVAGLSVPAPSLFGEQPGAVAYTFNFPVAWVSPRGRTCPASARLSREAKLSLWRERLAAAPGNPVQTWTEALWRCELRTWEDRAALLTLLVRTSQQPTDLLMLRNALDKESVNDLDRQVGRRYGVSRVWQAYLGPQSTLNWSVLMRVLADPTATLERKIQIAQAFRTIAPWDIDTRLELMSLYEQAHRLAEARRVGVDLRADPLADTRVRVLVGEMLLRAGDRDEGRRAFSEIAEFAPYDTEARQTLGDLLITYGGDAWADDAYGQYRTLAALRPGDPLPRVHMAIAASLAHREDEALRLLRGVVEDTGGDVMAPAVEALFVSEVARLATRRSDEAAVQSWIRVARLLTTMRDGAFMVRWNHPDVSLELRAFSPGDTMFTSVGDNAVPLGVRVYAPGPALEGSHIIVRGTAGLTGARTVTAHVALLTPDANGIHLVERDVTLSASTPLVPLVVRHGALIDDTDPVPPVERPTPSVWLY